MVKHKLKRLLALALSILLLSSEVTGLMTVALADGPEGATAASDVEQKPGEFRDPSNGRPNLFVNFLGDNDEFQAAGTAAARIPKGELPIPAAYDQSKASNVYGPFNAWERYVEANITDEQTIFWVGVGVDRKEVFELLKSDENGRSGLTSFEGGFYYDANVVEPYYDPAFLPAGANPSAPTAEQIHQAYQATIARANINNSDYPANTQWSDDYEILRAELNLAPETDLITQEEIAEPSITEIMTGKYEEEDGTPRDWRMTYVSLEMKTESLYSTAHRRLEGVYQGIERDEQGRPLHPEQAPASASGNGVGSEDPNPNSANSDYQYLILIPFRLKKFGGAKRLHLRLLRNATHFSIGASTYGTDVYGAWERVTTRNPGKDLKLLTRFTGDLYLFGDEPKAEEVEYNALLKIINGGGSDNTAVLRVDGDPAVWPVYADADDETINGLQSGLGMRLDVHAQNGYKVEVTVTYKGNDKDGNQTDIAHSFQSFITGQDSYYTFVMPQFVPTYDRTVTVTVRFTYDNREEFNIYLSDIPQPENDFYVDSNGNLLVYKTGNETTITTNLDEHYEAVEGVSHTINTFDPVVRHPNTSHTSIVNPYSPDPDRAHADGPMGTATREKGVSIQVRTHADYEAVVRLYRFDEHDFLGALPGRDAAIDASQYSWTAQNEIILPNGGTIKFQMPLTDLDVEVVYRLANRRKATLEVYHTGVDDEHIPEVNVAQLVYQVYDDENVPSMAYGGVVYEDGKIPPSDPRHRQVKTGTDNKKLPWVSRSAATLSGSLGGDTGRTGRNWLPASGSDMSGSSSVMALLYSSTDLPSFQAMLSGLDLASTVITEDSGGNATLTGLRKNLYGDLYSDADVPQMAEILWELRNQILNDPTLEADYVKEVTRPGTSTVAYTYFDLTAAQVQDYLLTIFRAEDANNANQSAYRTASRAYRAAEVVYTRLKDKTGYEALDPLIKPAPPADMEVDGSTFVRTYQADDYRGQLGGLSDYNTYIKAYQTYVEKSEEKGSPDSDAAVAPGTVNNLHVPVGSDTMKAIAVKKVALKGNSDAVTAINSMDWKTSDIGTSPTIETREERTVWVVLEADSAYELDSIQLFSRREDGGAGTELIGVAAPKRVDGYQNVYSFEMPGEDCVVRVTYRKRGTRKLNISVVGADGMKQNLTTVEAYTVGSPATVPKLETRTNDGHWNTTPYRPDSIEDVFIQSTITVHITVHEDYKVEVLLVNAVNMSPISPVSEPTEGRDGIYTFQVPATHTGAMELTVTYTPKELPLNTATIRGKTASEVTTGGHTDNTALWLENGNHYTVLNDVPEKQALVGEITVAPGYYIKSVTAYGASGNYPYTLTGNGYNGGFGTTQSGTSVPVNVFVNMPGEDLIVEVVFGYGIPPAAPENTLTLIVKDDDNKGKDEDDKPVPFAPNYAWATVYDDRSDYLANASSFEQRLPATAATDPAGIEPHPVGGVLGKHENYGGGVLVDSKYVETGKWVKVDFSAYQAQKANGDPDPDNSYYVSKVTVGPANLAVSMVWEGDRSVSFYMPAGSTGITVEFSKGAKPTHFLRVQETYADEDGRSIPFGDLYANDSDTVEKNRATRVMSDTIRLWWEDPDGVALQAQTNPERVPPENSSQGTEMGVAVAGEEVTVRFRVDMDNWYVQSVVVISDGAAYRGSYKLDPSGIGEATFRMPTGDAEFLIHYRKGPRKEKPDYAFTLTLSDPDNLLEEGVYDDNHITASFRDASGGGVGVHDNLTVGNTPTAGGPVTEGMTGVRHIHAGDVITLDTVIAKDYTLEYMLVNPTALKIHPVWTSTSVDADGVTHATATLTMPPEGIAVVARVVKGEPQKYTANLILHPPEGMNSMKGVGQGTFTGFTGGSLAGYHQSAVFSTYATPGTTIPYDLYAFDGYYIDRITVDPPLGVTGSLSGSFGYQDGEFTMPAANVNVNVWFRKGWPDQVPYYLDLEVHDASFNGSMDPLTGNNYASFSRIVHKNTIDPFGLGSPGEEYLTGDEGAPVYGGKTKRLRADKGAAYDRDDVYVAINPREGFYADSTSISVTDTAGQSIPWRYVSGGIVFTMPPRSVTVRVNFKQREADSTTYEARLHVADADGTDQVELSTEVTHAVGSPVTEDGKSISELYAGDGLKLKVTPGTGRCVTAVYAVNHATKEMVELSKKKDDGSWTRATLVFTGGDGEFAMPEADVDVYVRFSDEAVGPDDLPLTLVVSGPEEANPANGHHGATAEVTGQTSAEHKTMEVDAPGMDTRFVKENNHVVVTFEPNKDAGYGITKLEVYDTDGNPVPYEWISMLQDPPTGSLDDPTVWPGTAPENIADHPGWKQNPELQITLDMPDKGVVVHVTYGKMSDTEYTAQIVVNDEVYSDQPTPSRNNAWFDETLKNKLRTAKPGQWVDIDVSVHPGYRIEYIKVVPQSFGILPGLPLGPYYTQSTGFVMPEGNVTVYVKFADDGIEEYSATLRVTGQPLGVAANYGTIVSPRNTPTPPARPTPVYVNGAPQTVVARAEMDWVTVNYYRNNTSYIKSVTVRTAGGVQVPFTQLEDPGALQGTITFPMVRENVTVTVEYDTEPHDAEIYLHVIDDTNPPVESFSANASLYDAGGMAIIPTTSPLRRDAANPWGNTVGPKSVAAGQRVRLLTSADNDNGIYLRSAYVLYEDVGQMVDLTQISATAGTSQKSFVVHPGENHIYVTFGNKPDPNDHAAILMLRAPEDDAGRASIAAGGVYGAGNPPTTDQDSLDRANHGHAQVIATRGERVYIQVAPAEGYVIDTVLVTPLGFPLQTHGDYHYTMVGNTISFDMPHRDVAITVTLKRGTNQHYNVKLHYVKDTQDVNINDAAILTWTEGAQLTLRADLTKNIGTDHPDAWENVQETQIREGTEVTLTGHLVQATDPTKPDTILSAFVLRSNGTLVRLDPPLEGKQADGTGNVDHSAAFTMPAADVDVFLVVTTDPPPTPWYTAVLVVTDTSPSKVNSGLNEGYIWKDGAAADRKKAFSVGSPGCVWIPLAEGETFLVEPKAAPGYAFVPPATDTCNDGTHGGNMRMESTAPYQFSRTMERCNRAALLHFVSDEALDLTVILRDPENPGDGTATQKLLTRQPTASPAVDDLTLTSANVGGAYQVMKGVTPGESVLITATPAEGFTATAQIRYIDGSVEDIPLTDQGDGTLTGSILMPANNATLIVTFHGDYKGTLRLVDKSAADKTEQATMHENSGTAPDRVTVNHMTTDRQATLEHLPQGTLLTANMLRSDNLGTKTVTALLTRNGYTTIMTPSGQNAEGVDEYTHTINRADATITFVVRDHTDPTYVAAVRTVNRPDEAKDPAIENTTDPDADRDLSDSPTWTAAVQGDRVEVTLHAPIGYEARVTTDRPELELTDTDGVLTTGTSVTVTGDNGTHTLSFSMPEANVQVTVTYVKTRHRLTLNIQPPNGAGATTQVDIDPAGVESGTNPLIRNGHWAYVQAGTEVTLTTATPGPDYQLLSAIYAAEDGSSGFLDVGEIFEMPAADTVVTVRYGQEERFIALVEVVDNDHMPDNVATDLVNLTHGTFPGDLLHWVEGQTGDAIQVNYTIEPGYVARVTAYKRDDSSTLDVANVASASNGMATVKMPGGTDIVIRIEYVKDDGPKEGDVILQLVQHGAQAGNRADVTSPFAVDPTLGLLATNGTAPIASATTTASHYLDSSDATSPVETEPVSTSVTGNELFVYANWANSYQVVRMTVAVRNTATGFETPEVPIAISRYGSAAAGRTLMPYVDKANNEAAVVRVYYGNIFWARLHIVPHGTDNRDVNGNATSATDNRPTTVTSVAGKTTIERDGDRLLDFMGGVGETVQTLAVPDKDPPNNQRLVGVVWESASTGAASAKPREADPNDSRYSTDDWYDFEMPADNVDFYAVYETDDPENRSYIAKVAFDGTEHLGNSQNAVTITNKSDNDAAHGAYWTAAKKDDMITVNVKVAPGYKAEIIRTCKDDIPLADHATPPDPTKPNEHYDFYINRTKFVPNLVLGKDATFSMPADTDATVTIRFTKGYDLSLEVVDSSKLADGAADPARVNKATVTTDETPTRTLEGISAKEDGTGITYNTDPKAPVLKAVGNGKIISTQVQPASKADGETAQYKVYRSSPFTGTERVDAPTGTPLTRPPSPYDYEMPSSDVVETVLFYNEKTPLLAKVEVKGESDINGNTATPIKDYTDTVDTATRAAAANETVRGTVWTTTTHATTKTDAHTIDLTLTVAKGYIAKIRVRRDNDNYYNNPNDETKWDWLDFDDYEFTAVTETAASVDESAPPKNSPVEAQMGYQSELINMPSQFDADVSGDQHFRFTMAYDTTEADANGKLWTATDVTVIVEFVFAGEMPRPFDPDNGITPMEKIELERGFIYGENRGDFAFIDIPTLYRDDDKTLAETKKYESSPVSFTFYLYDIAKDEYTPLVTGTDVILEPYNTKEGYTQGDPYNYYDYKTKRATPDNVLDDNVTGNDESTYTGSKFNLIPTAPDKNTGDRTAGAQALYDILNNNGSVKKDGAGKNQTILYVMAENAMGKKSAYTQVWLRPHFSIEVAVISYAPNHTTTASVYKLMDQDAMDLATGYKDEDGNVVDGVAHVEVDLNDPTWALDFKHYRWNDDDEPYLSNDTRYEGEVLGASKYYQTVRVMSSELLGGYDETYDPDKDPLAQVDPDFDARYALTVEKASCLTYTRVLLDLRPTEDNGFDLTDPNKPTASFYKRDGDGVEDNAMTYTISDAVYLITGDVNGDGFTKWQDYDAVYAYVWRNYPWNNTQTEAPDPKAPGYTAQQAKDWLMSTYNPDSMAYRCDLNGDRVLSVQDLNLVQTLFDYNRSVKDYLWTKRNEDGTLGEAVFPFGFDGSVKSKDPNKNPADYVALFGLTLEGDGLFPVAPDRYWDALVDPNVTDAPPLDNPWVDENGQVWDGPIPETPEEVRRPAASREEDRREDGTVMEIPVGDEIDVWIETPVFDQDWIAELPFLAPEEKALPIADDNGPDEGSAETPADITTEE